MSVSPESDDSREQRLNAVLSAYLEASDAGWAPPAESLLTRYPDLADELRSFFAIQAQVADLASPLPGVPAHVNGVGHTRQRELNTLPSRAVRVRPSAPAVPLRIGEYESLELIKEAGMGVVYKAWQKGANRWVALKMIRDGECASAEEVHRFRREAEAAANLDHPHIVPIYDVDEHDGMPFFSMKLFEAGNLHQHLPTYTKDLRAGVKLLATVCRAVHYGHQRGILHRDLKPANILLDATGQPHVADFGLAKRMFAAPGDDPPVPASPATDGSMSTVRPKHTGAESVPPASIRPPGYYALPKPASVPRDATASATIDLAPHHRTETNAVFGTFGYMPPEQAGIQGDVSVAADVFSLGAILYQLMTGEPPLATMPRAEALRQARECNPMVPSARKPGVDRRLEAVCMKCLRKEPGERYASAQALAEDLDRWLAGDWPLAWTPPWPLRAARAVRRRLLTGIITALLTFAAATIFFAAFYFDPERPLRPIYRELRAGRPVDLIGERGMPAWQRWKIGAGASFLRTDKEGTFSVAAADKGRLELLPETPMPRYRFSAEVKHTESWKTDGTVGIYFGYSGKQDADGLRHFWWDLDFADLGADAVRRLGPDPQHLYAEAKLTPGRFLLPVQGQPNTFVRLTELSTPFLSARELKEAPPWRKLAVEVTPENVRLLWQTQVFRELSVAKLQEYGEPSFAGPTEVFPEIPFTPQGGLGLCVHRGKASFRNVKIEPLK